RENFLAFKRVLYPWTYFFIAGSERGRETLDPKRIPSHDRRGNVADALATAGLLLKETARANVYKKTFDGTQNDQSAWNTDRGDSDRIDSFVKEGMAYQAENEPS